MSPRPLRIVLALAFSVTVAAALFPTEEPSIVGPVARGVPTSGAIGAAAAAPTEAAPQSRPSATAYAPASGNAPDSNPAGGAAAGIAILDIARLRRPPSVIQGGDPFVLPPPPAPPAPKPGKAAAPPPPPPPMAPPLPFRMVGSIDEDGKVTVFAERANGDVVALRVAEIVDNTYRVDSIDARTMTLTYLPLGQKQTLPLGEAIR